MQCSRSKSPTLSKRAKLRFHSAVIYPCFPFLRDLTCRMKSKKREERERREFTMWLSSSKSKNGKNGVLTLVEWH
jgi:hypothetical protein